AAGLKVAGSVYPLVGAGGFEPPASRLLGGGSTPELCARDHPAGDRATVSPTRAPGEPPHPPLGLLVNLRRSARHAVRSEHPVKRPGHLLGQRRRRIPRGRRTPYVRRAGRLPHVAAITALYVAQPPYQADRPAVGAAIEVRSPVALRLALRADQHLVV